MKEKKEMSLGAKIALIISVIAFIVAIAILVIILTDKKEIETPSDPKNNIIEAIENKPTNEAIEFIQNKLDGYWTFDNQFIGFIKVSNKPYLEYGLYQSSFGERGEIKEAIVSGENSISIEIFIEATPESMMDEARPARTEYINIDVSTLNLDNRLSIKIDNLGDSNWHTYEYGGKTIEDAYSN